MIKTFRKIQTVDRDLNRVQDQVFQALNPVLKNVLIDSVQINDIQITTSGVDIDHGLGRVPLGWFVVDSTASATVWRTAWTDRILSLDASGTATISIVVF